MEVEHYLREWDYPDPVIQRVIETLEEYRYLDDRVFARQWARDRMVHRHWGPLRLRIELQRKGILKEWVEESIRELFNDRGEEEMALKAIRRRLRASGLRDPRERRRWFSYLLRRGYSSDVIQAVFNRIERGVEPHEG